MKGFSYRGMKSIENMGPHSDIPRIIRSVFPLSERFLYRKSICLKAEGQWPYFSIDRHNLHPNVRGKGTKSVEFGMTVNNIQKDGI